MSGTPLTGGGLRSLRIRLAARVPAEPREFYAVVGIALLLALIGIVMVFSTSLSTNPSVGFLSTPVRHALYLAVGFPFMLVLSRMREEFWMRVAWLMLGTSWMLQILVVATPLGVRSGGNTNWLALGPVTFQPSELIKLSLVVWLGMIVTRKQAVLHEFRRGVLPILLVASCAVAPVLIGGDLGTTMVIAASVFGALFLYGVRLRLLLLPVGAVSAIFLLFAWATPSRVRRISEFLAGKCTDANTCWQVAQGNFALANGGLTGVGLGQSTSKWSWLPEANNDFIFAVIGEETGIGGCLTVVVLFVLLTLACGWAMRRARTPFGRAAAGAVVCWIAVQAFLNMGVVVGLFPVLGVPLPLISAGGSALVTTLAGLGIVLSVAHAGVRVRRTG